MTLAQIVETFTVLALLALVVGGLLIYRPSRRSARESTKDTGQSEAIACRCVEVVYHDATCCRWVRQLAGRRLLPEQARLFPLPLSECDASRCRCRYVHHRDRRVDDRRTPFSATIGGALRTERRRGSERRTGAAAVGRQSAA